MRTSTMRRLPAVVPLALVILLAGCGSPAILHRSSTISGEPAPSPRPGATSQATSLATSRSAGQATPQTAGQVTLTLSQQQYGTQEPLLVTIHNGLQTSIWVLVASGGCPSLVVEHLALDGWQPVGQCAPALATTHAVAVAPGGTLMQRLTYAQGADTGAGWPVGTYRVKLQYALSGTAEAVSGGPTTYSPRFTIS